MSTLNQNALRLALLLCVTSACSDQENTSRGGGPTGSIDTGSDTTTESDVGTDTGGEGAAFTLTDATGIQCFDSLGSSTTIRVGGNCSTSIGVNYGGAEFSEPIVLSVDEELPPGVTAEFRYVDPAGLVPRTGAGFELLIRGVASAGPLTFTVRGTTASHGSSTLSYAINITSPPGFPLASVSTGYQTTCGLDASGQAYCWGGNDYGQLGLGTSGIHDGDYKRTRPVAAAGALRFTRVSVGRDMVCGLDFSGQAYCWGQGWLGDGQLHEAGTPPTPVAGGHTFVDIAVNSASACGLTSGGSIYCWAGGNGSLGDGTYNTGEVPTDISAGRSYEAIASEAGTACAIATGGTVYCWGDNTYGQVGPGEGEGPRVLAPTPIAASQPFRAVGVSVDATCALTDAGDVYCWGDNRAGALGLGQFDNDEHPTPTLVPGGVQFSTLSGGEEGFCGLDPAGRLYCWSFAGSAERSGEAVPGVTELAGGVTFSQIDVGKGMSCGIATNGLQAAYCWIHGSGNTNGYLGTGDTESYSGPVPIAGP